MRSIRRIQAWGVTIALAAVCVLTLSDSVVGPLRRLAGLGLRVVHGVESVSGFDLVSRPELPVGSDTLGHFLAWATIGLVGAGLARGALNRIYLFLGLLQFSAFLEVGQEYLSWSRTPELTDLMANGAGLVLGFTTYGVLVWVFGPIAGFVTGRSGPGSFGRPATAS